MILVKPFLLWILFWLCLSGMFSAYTYPNDSYNREKKTIIPSAHPKTDVQVSGWFKICEMVKQ